MLQILFGYSLTKTSIYSPWTLLYSRPLAGFYNGVAAAAAAAAAAAFNTAGIVPYTVNPKTQEVYLILGKECDYIDIPNSRVFLGFVADFGGKRIASETPEMTAARECCEESAALLGEYEDLKQSLERKEYAVKVKISSIKRKDMSYDLIERYYYLKYFPWDGTLPRRFFEVTTMLRDVSEGDAVPAYLENHPALLEGPGVDLHYLEKSEIALWSLDRIRDTLRSNGHWKKYAFRRSLLPFLKFTLTLFQKNILV